ncbi:MAG: hypothetical protein M3P27_09700 [Acidobacteriota bacterium]|nr:hypothetical protein [Acidobacteriota bacterium]
MKLLIDNTDYTSALAADSPPHVTRKLNRPSTLVCAVVLAPSGPVVPVANARVVLQREDGVKLFTGYLDAIPKHEYLGWSQHGPEYRMQLAATSDEVLLDRKLLPYRPFVSRTAGNVLRQLVNDLLPSTFDLAEISDLDLLPAYISDIQKSWSEHAGEIALRARASYRVNDGAIRLQAVGAVQHVIAETDPAFDPDGLKLAALPRLVNDATIIGRTEPRLRVKDYFLGDGLTLQFSLSRSPFTRFTSTLVDEEFEGATLDPLRWTKTDPAGALSVLSGKLTVAGGTGIDGQTTVVATEQTELGGALLLQHGEFSFTAASNLVAGGLYTGAITIGNCFAGFRITPSGAQSVIQALINGVATGPTITTVTNHRYGLTTRTYAGEAFRRQQVFHSSVHPAGSARGGATVASDVRLVLEVHDIDPASPGSQAAASTVLYDGVLASAPAFCAFALLDILTAHCSTSFTRHARVNDAEVRSQIPAQAYRTRLVGALADGGECQVLSLPALQFFSQYPPAASEKIVVRYRSRSRALVRIVDLASIAAHAVAGDDGVRSALRTVASPSPRTSTDCENAALALLDDSIGQAWSGQYSVWSDFLPTGSASDVWPGDAFAIDVPSRTAAFSAIVREVEIECMDLAGDGSRYRIAFANEAAQPLGFEFDPARLNEELDVTATTATTGATFLADLAAAEITDATSTTVDIDAGNTPPAGGGIEVRRSDRNWGLEDDRDLTGRFTTRTFTVTRLTRTVDFYLRQYDNSSPPKYSRSSTLLHLGWPLF